MKIAIFGAGKAGKFLYDITKKYAENIEILGFIDSKLQGSYDFIDSKLQGSYDCIDIMKPERFFEKYQEKLEAVFIAAGAQKTVYQMIHWIKKYSECDIYMLHDIAGKCQVSPYDEKGKIISWRLRKIRFADKKPTLPYIEVPITDKCNLNCKGCLFACNAMIKNEHIGIGQIIKDAKKMSELFEDIPWIRILGGEPLMHPNIEKILREYRRIFSDSEIDLCTNGLLIPQMKASFFECLKENRITVHVSGYKPTYGILDKVDRILKEYNLDYTVLKREKFAKYYTKEPNNCAEQSFGVCMASGCRELYKGRLLRCSGVIAFEKFNEQFGTPYIITEDEDWFDIHNPLVKAWEVKKKIDKASSICRYCNIVNIEEFDWDYGGNKPELKDYIIES